VGGEGDRARVAGAPEDELDTSPAPGKWTVFSYGGRTATGREALPKGVAPQQFYAQPGMISTVIRVDGKPVLVSELKGDQMGLFKKFASTATTVQPVDLGEFGLWIHGGAHVLMWQLNFGRVHRVETRLAGNVVLWLVSGTTYRLEGDLDKSQMLKLAGQITR